MTVKPERLTSGCGPDAEGPRYNAEPLNSSFDVARGHLPSAPLSSDRESCPARSCAANHFSDTPRSVRQIQLSRMSAIRPSAHSGGIVLDGLMAEIDRTEFRSMEVLIDSAGGRFISAESWIPPRKTNLRGSGAPASPLLTHLTNPRRPCTKCSDASPCRENSHDVDGKNTEIR